MLLILPNGLVLFVREEVRMEYMHSVFFDGGDCVFDFYSLSPELRSETSALDITNRWYILFK